MKVNIAAQKEELRAQSKAFLRSISTTDLNLQSARIADRISAMPEWDRAKTILGFVPGNHEPDINKLLKEAISTGKRICLPQFNPIQTTYSAVLVSNPNTDLISGKYGVLEPKAGSEVIPFSEIDCVLVPGLAFDSTGGRLGRGGGWFDRMLAEIRGLRIGVAFSVQLVGNVPVESHDIRMDCLVTAEELIRAK